MQHRSVLLDEVVATLCCQKNGYYIDGTFGRGGHSRVILSYLDKGKLWGVDKDHQAVYEGEKLAKKDARFTMIHASFADIYHIFHKTLFDGILLDLGVSSPQLENAARGFSFMRDGPLDMRMDVNQELNAKIWLAKATEEEIAKVIWQYGEEKFSRRIAKAIVQARKQASIESTQQLAQIVKSAHPRWQQNRHPATKTFQAIRILVNQELTELENFLHNVLKLLKPKGRLVIISFHSLEDRIVKRFMRDQELGKAQLRNIPQPNVHIPNFVRIGKIKPNEDEVQKNPQARSAILRFGEKI